MHLQVVGLTPRQEEHSKANRGGRKPVLQERTGMSRHAHVVREREEGVGRDHGERGADSEQGHDAGAVLPEVRGPHAEGGHCMQTPHVKHRVTLLGTVKTR